MKFIPYLTLCIFLCIPSMAASESTPYPPPVPGYTHDEELRRDTPESHGITLSGGDVQFGSPTVAEIDGVTANGLEVALGSADGVLYVYRSDGSLLWERRLPNNSCRFASGQNKLYSAPAVGTIFGDGVPYVLSSYGGLGSKQCDGGVVAFKGSDGTLTWKFSTKKFSRGRFGTNMHGVFSSPALSDTDGDGRMEIGFGSFDRNVYLLNANGSLRWYYNAADTVWSSPGFVNVDSEPDLEMIIGTDISQNKFLRPPTENGGYVYAFKTAAREEKHISFRDTSAYVWQSTFDQVIYSSPVIADVLPETPGPEIIIISGCFFPQGTKNKKGKWIKILRLRDGKLLKTLDIPACSSSSVAVGDLDDDGRLEIVATVNGSKSIGGDGASKIIAFKAAIETPLWSVTPRVRGRNDDWGGLFSSPVIADLDGNGSLEVIAATGNAVGIFNGKDGTALTCQESSCDGSQPLLFAWKTLRGTPAIADMNADGELDIVIGGGHPANRKRGMLYGWSMLSGRINSAPGIQTPFSTPWPMYRGNANHTALFGD